MPNRSHQPFTNEISVNEGRHKIPGPIYLPQDVCSHPAAITCLQRKRVTKLRPEEPPAADNRTNGVCVCVDFGTEHIAWHSDTHSHPSGTMTGTLTWGSPRTCSAPYSQ